MPIEIFESRGSVEFDVDDIANMVKAHDDGDVGRVVTGYRAMSPDGRQIASRVPHVTGRLGVSVADQVGLVRPTLFARQVVARDRLSGGGGIAIEHRTTGPTPLNEVAPRRTARCARAEGLVLVGVGVLGG